MGYITAFRLIKADYHRYSALAELGVASFLKIMLLERGLSVYLLVEARWSEEHSQAFLLDDV